MNNNNKSYYHRLSEKTFFAYSAKNDYRKFCFALRKLVSVTSQANPKETDELVEVWIAQGEDLISDVIERFLKGIAS